MTVGERLKFLRESVGASQKTFGEAIGIKQSSYHSAESDRTELGHDRLRLLSELYNANLHWLITGEGDMLKGSASEVRYEQFSVPTSQVAEPPAPYGSTLSYIHERDNEFTACKSALEAALEKITLLEARLRDKEELIEMLKSKP